MPGIDAIQPSSEVPHHAETGRPSVARPLAEDVLLLQEQAGRDVLGSAVMDESDEPTQDSSAKTVAECREVLTVVASCRTFGRNVLDF